MAGIVAEVLTLAVEAVFIRDSEPNDWRGSKVAILREGALVRAREVGASKEAIHSIVRVGSSSISNRCQILELLMGNAAGEMVLMLLWVSAEATLIEQDWFKGELNNADSAARRVSLWAAFRADSKCRDNIVPMLDLSRPIIVVREE